MKTRNRREPIGSALPESEAKMRKHNLPPLILILFISISQPAYSQIPAIEDPSLVVDHIEGPSLEVHFIDVGQGDAILLRSPDGQTMMIDAGPSKNRKKTLAYLSSVGVTSLDYVVITHSHLDHLGGLAKLLKAVPVKKVLSSGKFHSTKTNEKLLKAIEKAGIPMVQLTRGDTFKLGEEISVSVLHPPTGWSLKNHDPNNLSVVLRVTYGDVDFLITGDAEVEAEAEILKSGLIIDSEFLKAGHHGSRTASSLEFLEKAEPKFTVISCGTHNKYGHPHEETIQSLKKHHSTILRTDELGTIIVRTNGKKVSISVKGSKTSWIHLPLRPGTINVTFMRREDETIACCCSVCRDLTVRCNSLDRAA